jgi:hypothetical protein
VTVNVTPEVEPLRLAGWRIPSFVKAIGHGDDAVLDFRSHQDRPLTQEEVSDLYRPARDLGILDAFLDVAELGQPGALAFARTYGPLRLNAAGRPAGSAVDPRLGLLLPHRFEPIRRIIFYSAVARAVLEAAQSLHRDGTIPSGAWGPLLDLWDELEQSGMEPWLEEFTHPRMTWRRPDSGDPLVPVPLSPTASWLVTNTVNWWIRTSWIAPHFEWTRTGTHWSAMGPRGAPVPNRGGGGRPGRRAEPVFGIHIQGGHREQLGFVLSGGCAWGALGVRLAEAVLGMSHGREEHCAYQAPGCRGWFSVKRACPANRRPCCGQPACRAAAAARRQREHRARTRR